MTKNIGSLTPLHSVDPTPQMADSILAQTMNRLSMKEREQAFEDVHGVADVVTEETEFVNRCLDELQTQLDIIPPNIKTAYDMARSQCLEYVSDRKFRLMFLRTESFQPQPAALRMTSFFRAKLELFGPDKLTKNIQLADLDQLDMLCLESGYLQLLPGRDRSGRPVICLIPFCAPLQATTVNKLRTLWYIFMTAMEDDDSQRCGLVAMVYNVGPKRRMDREAVRKACVLMSELPIKMVALHYCYDDPKIQIIVSLGVPVLETRTRTRLRPHIGSAVEILYKLLTFGITQEILPFSANGTIKLENHNSFIQRRRSGESAQGDFAVVGSKQQQKEERVVVPHPFDVLLGRGRHGMAHPGNRRLQNMIDEYSGQYERGDRFEKTVLAEMVVGLMKKPQQKEPGVSSALLFGGGRFLTNDTIGWKVMDDEMARGRVSHKFRNRRRQPASSKKVSTTTMTAVAAAATHHSDTAPRLTEQLEPREFQTNNVFGCFNGWKRQRLA